MTFSGLALVIAGEAAIGLDFSGVEWLGNFYNETLVAIIGGMLILLIGLIAWATRAGLKTRAVMAALSLAPLPVILSLLRMAGLFNVNTHRILALLVIASTPLLLASVPLFAAGVLLGIMAIAARRRG